MRDYHVKSELQVVCCALHGYHQNHPHTKSTDGNVKILVDIPWDLQLELDKGCDFQDKEVSGFSN